MAHAHQSQAKLATLGIPLDELMSWFAQETSKIVSGMGMSLPNALPVW